MRRFLIALQFLTIFPVKISAKGARLPDGQRFASGEKSEIKGKDFGASLLYFPLVGLLIGLLLCLGAFLFSFLPALIKGAIILIISIFITGGIHLDGFADTCDGFYGNRPKERILEVMRDSRIGAMGVIGIVSLLLLKFSLIVSLPERLLWKALIEMAVFARWSQALASSISCYARQEGKARYFIEYAGNKEILLATLFTLGVFFLLLKMNGLILFLASLLPVFLFINFTKRKIGGMTGDTIGATNEIAETGLLFFNLIYGLCVY